MLSKDDLCETFSSLSGGLNVDHSAEVILHSVEEQYKYLEILHKENYLNDLVENYSFFTQCDDAYDRILNLCSIMMESEHLSSKITSLTCETKLLLQIPKQGTNISNFTNKLMKIIKDKTQIPLLRQIATNCFYEIAKVYPKLVKLDQLDQVKLSESFSPTTQILNIKKSLSDNNQMESYVNQRFYAMNPIEKMIYSPKTLYPENTVPNDPIQLNNAIKTKSILKNNVLSIIENPLSQFGLTTMIENSAQDFNFTKDEIITKIDSESTQALKMKLLPPVIDSINPDFAKSSPNSTLAIATFKLADRFSHNDIILLFRRFFKISSQLDDLWFSLFQQQEKHVKSTLICFLSNFPTRRAYIKASLDHTPLLSAPALYNISNIDDEISQMVNNSIHDECSLESIFAQQKVSKTENPINCSDIESVPCMFTAKDVEFHVYNQSMAIIVMRIAAKEKLKEPIIGITITTSCAECFSTEGSKTIPVSDFSQPEEITLELVAKKAADTRIYFNVVFSTLDGQTKLTTIEPVNIQMYEFFSPSDVDFLLAWSGTQESRLFLQEKLHELENLLRQTMFGISMDNEGGEIHSVVSTPDGQLIALRAMQNSTGVTVAIKANDISYIASIDSFLRIIHKLVNK